MLDNRIDAGVRSGRLSRGEAVRLRAQFREIANTEARYRRNGLTMAERRSLERMFDGLENRLTIALNDRDRRRWRG